MAKMSQFGPTLAKNVGSVWFFFFSLSCAFCGIAWCHDQNQQLFYCCSVAKLCLTLCNSMDCSSNSIDKCINDGDVLTHRVRCILSLKNVHGCPFQNLLDLSKGP